MMMLSKMREDIVKVMNESELPIDAVYFVLKDIMNEVVNQYNYYIEQDRAEMAAQESSAEVVEEQPQVEGE